MPGTKGEGQTPASERRRVAQACRLGEVVPDARRGQLASEERTCARDDRPRHGRGILGPCVAREHRGEACGTPRRHSLAPRDPRVHEVDRHLATRQRGRRHEAPSPTEGDEHVSDGRHACRPCRRRWNARVPHSRRAYASSGFRSTSGASTVSITGMSMMRPKLETTDASPSTVTRTDWSIHPLSATGYPSSMSISASRN